MKIENAVDFQIDHYEVEKLIVDRNADGWQLLTVLWEPDQRDAEGHYSLFWKRVVDAN